jgi:signal transduction histidine kinase
MKQHSIARRLIATVLLVELIAALSVTAIAFLYERHSHFRSFDVMLRGRADSVLGAVQDAEDPGDHVMLDKADLHLPVKDVYEVRDEFGQLLGRSGNWSGPGSQVPASQTDQSFMTLSINGKQYRTLFLHGVRIVDPDDKDGGKPRQVTVLYGSPTRPVWESTMEAVNFYAAFSLLLLIVTGIVMAWLLNRSMAPLRELATQAAGVSVGSWQFQPSEEVRATKELAPLTQTLENLLSRLEHSFLQERRFVSDAAHELKTGVAVVKSSLQLLSMKQRTAEEYQAGLERCQADCQRMEEIVAKMLTLARVEHVPAAHDRTVYSTDMAAHLRQIANQLKPMAEIQKVHLVLSLPPSLEVALTAEECDLLCSNLLLNALQHSGPETSIAIFLRRHGNDVEFRLEDQGEGIDPSVLPHLFERFYRGDPSRDRKTGGTGLGLAICKAIVNAARGEIYLKSTPGVGTTVAVHLPPASKQQSDASKELASSPSI